MSELVNVARLDSGVWAGAQNVIQVINIHHLRAVAELEKQLVVWLVAQCKALQCFEKAQSASIRGYQIGGMQLAASCWTAIDTARQLSHCSHA